MRNSYTGVLDIIVGSRVVEIAKKVDIVDIRRSATVESIRIAPPSHVAFIIRGPFKFGIGVSILKGNAVSDTEPIIDPGFR